MGLLTSHSSLGLGWLNQTKNLKTAPGGGTGELVRKSHCDWLHVFALSDTGQEGSAGCSQESGSLSHRPEELGSIGGLSPELRISQYAALPPPSHAESRTSASEVEQRQRQLPAEWPLGTKQTFEMDTVAIWQVLRTWKRLCHPLVAKIFIFTV